MTGKTKRKIGSLCWVYRIKRKGTIGSPFWNRMPVTGSQCVPYFLFLGLYRSSFLSFSLFYRDDLSALFLFFHGTRARGKKPKKAAVDLKEKAGEGASARDNLCHGTGRSYQRIDGKKQTAPSQRFVFTVHARYHHFIIAATSP